MNPLRVAFDLTTDDQLAVADVVAEHDPVVAHSQRPVQVVLILFAATIFFVQFLLIATAGDEERHSWAVPILTIILLAALFPSRSKMKSSLRKASLDRTATRAGEMLLGPRVMIFDVQGMRITYPYATSHVEWAALLSLILTDEYLFVVAPGPNFLPIPRRAFARTEEFDRFAVELKRQLVVRNAASEQAFVGF